MNCLDEFPRPRRTAKFQHAAMIAGKANPGSCRVLPEADEAAPAQLAEGIGFNRPDHIR